MNKQNSIELLYIEEYIFGEFVENYCDNLTTIQCNNAFERGKDGFNIVITFDDNNNIIKTEIKQ